MKSITDAMREFSNNEIEEAKKLSKKAVEKMVNTMFNKFGTGVQFDIFNLSNVSDPSEKILLAGGSVEDAEKAMKAAVAKYREN